METLCSNYMDLHRNSEICSMDCDLDKLHHVYLVLIENTPMDVDYKNDQHR